MRILAELQCINQLLVSEQLTHSEPCSSDHMSHEPVSRWSRTHQRLQATVQHKRAYSVDKHHLDQLWGGHLHKNTHLRSANFVEEHNIAYSLLLSNWSCSTVSQGTHPLFTLIGSEMS